MSALYISFRTNAIFWWRKSWIVGERELLLLYIICIFVASVCRYVTKKEPSFVDPATFTIISTVVLFVQGSLTSSIIRGFQYPRLRDVIGFAQFSASMLILSLILFSHNLVSQLNIINIVVTKNIIDIDREYAGDQLIITGFYSGVIAIGFLVLATLRLTIRTKPYAHRSKRAILKLLRREKQRIMVCIFSSWIFVMVLMRYLLFVTLRPAA